MKKNILMLLGPVLIMCFQETGEVHGADWVLYAVSLDGTIEEYYDRESVTPPEAGMVNVTTRAVKVACEEGRDKKKRDRGPEMARDNLPGCAYSITRHRIDCRSRVDTLMSSADYDGEGRKIQQSREPYVLARPPLRRSPQEIYPDSFSEKLIKMFCPPLP
jgi:hypothetical protein